MGIKVLDRTIEGDGPIFSVKGFFNVHVTGSLGFGENGQALVQLCCSQDGGETFDPCEDFNQPTERHRLIANCGTALFKFRLVTGNIVLNNPIKAYWNQ